MCPRMLAVNRPRARAVFPEMIQYVDELGRTVGIEHDIGERLERDAQAFGEQRVLAGKIRIKR